jgi:queuine tRNA-ribosyltransferase
MSLPNHFELLATDGACPHRPPDHAAWRGATPAFMPVGTAGAMKGMHWREVRDAGADIVLGNTYHLMLRPGAERIAALGGLQTFTGWNGPMLTDSGGFQVMSLSDLRKVSEKAVTFRSHIDGAKVELVAGAFDRGAAAARRRHRDADGRVRAAAGSRDDIERAMRLSLRWAERSKRAFETAPDGYMLFGIVQGGDIPEMRHVSARNWSRSVSTATRSAACGRRAAGGDACDDRGDRAGAAGGSPALSDGRRHARGSAGRRWRAASTCSTA